MKREVRSLMIVATAIAAMLSLDNQPIAAREFDTLEGKVHLSNSTKSVPALLNYQGYLATADSGAVNETLEMTFRLFDSAEGGAQLWSETHPAVEVAGGLFQVLLGSVTPFPGELFDASQLWLQTEVGTEVLAPRKPLVSVAYSRTAGEAEHATIADQATTADQTYNAAAAQHADSSDWADDAEHAVRADTAAYSPSTNPWTVSGDDVYRETGKVGIGTNTPTHTLDVTGEVNADTYYGDGSNLTGISGTTDNDWTIEGADIYHETGNVGIGTAGPTLGRLEVLASSGTGVYGGSSSGIGVFGYSASGQGLVGNSTTGHAGYFLGRLYISGDVGIGTEAPERQLHIKGANPRILIEASSINPEVNFKNSDDAGPETWALYKHGTTDDFRFYQSGDKMTIKSGTGYVGIGTTDPISQLHIKELSSPTYLTIESETGYTSGIVLNVNGTNEWRMYYHPINAMLSFYREGVGEKMVLENNGDVGIGTSTPSYTLHVVDTTSNDDQPAIYGEHAVQDWWGIGVKGVGLFKGVEGIVNATGGEDYYGVYGVASSSSGLSSVCGVYGQVTNGGFDSYGVYGTSDASAAVCGDRAGRDSYGWLGSWYRGAYGVNNSSSNSNGVEGQSYNGHGVHGYSDIGYAGYFSGDVHITGTLTGGKGSSTIDHPLDPENKLLRNNYVESPECLLIYRGKTRLDVSGRAVIELPEYFPALADEDEATVHLTPIGRSNSSQIYELCYEWKPGHADFFIYGEPMREISWMVTAERDDPVSQQLSQPVEEEKGPQSKVCDRGELLYPEAYGHPETMGKDYQRREKIAQLEKRPSRASKKAKKQ